MLLRPTVHKIKVLHTYIDVNNINVIYSHKIESVHFVRGKIVILIEANYRQTGCTMFYY